MPEEELVSPEESKINKLDNGRFFKFEDFQELQIEVGKIISIVSSRYEPDDELNNVMRLVSEFLELPESVHYTVYEWLEQLTDF